jgi:hypothetical protein
MPRPQHHPARLVYLFGLRPNLSTITPPCGEQGRILGSGRVLSSHDS